MISLSRIVATLACTYILAILAAAKGSPSKSNDSLKDVASGLNDTIIHQLNAYRSLHDTPPLVWNGSLANNAHAVAERSCPSDGTKHTRDDEGVRSMIVDCIKGIDSTDYLLQSFLHIERWYEDCQNYHITNHTGGEAFTKLIWNATTDVGCSWSPGPDEAVDPDQRLKISKFVCLFYPIGNADEPNAAEEYKRNVRFPEYCLTQI